MCYEENPEFLPVKFIYVIDIIENLIISKRNKKIKRSFDWLNERKWEFKWINYNFK